MKTREAVELAVLKWALCFNHHRLMASIGYISSTEAQANFHRQFAEWAVTMI
jgi:putative transposase